MRQRTQTGIDGESAAADWLTQHDYHIIETNYRSGRWGELDIIATHSSQLVFIEVKTRQNTKYGAAIEAVTPGKLQRLKRAAQHYKLTHAQLPDSMRFEVITVELLEEGWRINLYKEVEI